MALAEPEHLTVTEQEVGAAPFCPCCVRLSLVEGDTQVVHFS